MVRSGILIALFAASSLHAVTTIQGAQGLTVSIDSNGSYDITVQSPAWRLGGDIGRPLSNMAVNSGADEIGPYAEISFDYTVEAPRHAAIRSYSDQPAVLFSVNYTVSAPNTAPFPTLSRYPKDLGHVTFAGFFALPSFPGFGEEGPWVFYDSAANAFILSPASNFMVASTAWRSGSEIVTGISPRISDLPQGFSHQTVLVIENGINRAFDRWGRALTDLQHRTRPPNDADTTLKYIGFWTDAGSTYYYNTEPSLSYEDTLAAVKADFDRQGIKLGYMQLDSWFYPKGPQADWSDGAGGIYQYLAAPSLFSPGLQAFQQSLGVPLVTHARWIDSSSPYRQQYRVSGNVAVDRSYWDNLAGYIANAGVAAYEQDWLGDAAHADFNLSDPYAFLDNMAAAMAQLGLTMQYCMASPAHFLQGAKYNNLTTIRTSEDRLNRGRWTNFLYSSRLASALGIWPFADVFMSGETENLLVATLSAGPIGVGDRIGALDKDSLLRAVRPDGVIVKPDAPLVPLDTSYINDSQFLDAPMIASTYTDFGDSKAYYLFAYNRGPDMQVNFKIADLGVKTAAYVYNYFAGTGTLAGPDEVFSESMTDGRAYYVISPIGKSGIAILGDRGHFVSLGKKRVTQLADDGAVHVTMSFAEGETSRVLHGYSPSTPDVAAVTGDVGPVNYDPASQRFSLAVMPGLDRTASLEIKTVCASELCN
jgi:hypothetical protein